MKGKLPFGVVVLSIVLLFAFVLYSLVNGDTFLSTSSHKQPNSPDISGLSDVSDKLQENPFKQPQPKSTNDNTSPKKREIEFVPGELVIAFVKGTPEQEKQAVFEDIKAESHQLISASANMYQVVVAEGASVTEVQTQLISYKNIKLAEPNLLYYTQITPDDTDFTELWGLDNSGQSGGTADIDVNAPEAWERSTGSRNVIVAVIDTGVDYTHLDLANNMWQNPGEIAGNGVDDDNNGYIDDIYGIDAVNDDSDPMDDHYHGTHVAGTIGAEGNNGAGVVGVNWEVSIIACKFLSSSGSGSLADAIECLDYLYSLKTNHNIDIALSNNSWGGGGYSSALEAAIQLHNDESIIFVAAAGNSSNNNDASPSYPASYEGDNIVSVAAIDRYGNTASFTNYGATSVDIGAPGVDIYSTMPSDSYGSLSGTSMASPHVAGVLALLKADQPNLTMTELIEKLYEDGEPLTSLDGVTLTGKQTKLELEGEDTDGDGMPDYWETQFNLDPNDPSDASLDLDSDGLLNVDEYTSRTLPNVVDTDNDGLNDGEEVYTYFTNPVATDTDLDGLSDGDEVTVYFTSPANSDTDGDGLNDGTEVLTLLTDATLADTDGDSLGDGFEVQYGFDPLLDSGESALDGDSDGLTNYQEYVANTDPFNADTDGDLLSDSEEVNTYFTDPTKADTDDDNLTDYDEIQTHLTDPLLDDTDGDLMPDGFEVNMGLNPIVDDASLDPDLDGRSNYQEYLDGTDPNTNEVVESEPNDSISDAQSVDGVFTLSYSSDIGDESSNTSETIPHTSILGTGDASYDYYAFTVTTAPSMAIFDIDYGYRTNSDGSMDSDLVLYDANGSELIYSDDASSSYGENGSESGLDSFFTHQFTSTGTYYIRVGSFSRSPVATGGAYTLHISLEGALTDLDGDGMSDFWETSYGLDNTDPSDAAGDLDSDGLTNLAEFNADSDPTNSDTDADGLSDGDEVNTHFTSPILADTDSDGLSDGEEINTYSTDALMADTDSDGLLDGEEVTQYYTDPNLSDSDTDGLSDGYEVQYGFDPSSSDNHASLDNDSDGLSNSEEFSLGTNPTEPDSDSDGLNDYDEVYTYLTIPTNSDSDADAMPDGWEVQYALDPLADDAALDLDNDGWTNIQEYNFSSDPSDASSIPTEISAFSIDSSNDLYRIELLTGVTELVGNTNLSGDFEGLAFGPDGMLYAAEDSNNGLYKINPTTAVAEFIGYMSITGREMGLTFDTLGDLYLIGRDQLYSVDTTSAQTTSVSSFNSLYFYSLTWDGTDFYALSQSPTSLYKLDTINGQAELIGTPSGLTLSAQNGLSVDSFGQLWGMDEYGSVFEIDKTNGQVGSIITTLFGFESLAIENTADTDSDGMTDVWENIYGLDPNDPSDANVDTDNDGLTNLQEFSLSLDPTSSDTDNDDLLDGEEVNTYGTDPSLADSDGDVMTDGWEISFGLDPLLDDGDGDLDNDGVSNRLEFIWNSSPIDSSDLPILDSAYGVSNSGDLVEINLLDGTTTTINSFSGSYDFTSLAFNPQREMLTFNDSTDELLAIAADMQSLTSVVQVQYSPYRLAMAVTDENVLYTNQSGRLQTLDTDTGTFQTVGYNNLYSTYAVAWDGEYLYTVDYGGTPTLYRLDSLTGEAVFVGELDSNYFYDRNALAFDSQGNLWVIDNNGYLLLINKDTAETEHLVSVPAGMQNIAIFVMKDDDQDGMHDPWEVFYSLDPTSALDATTDLDNDGLSNFEEYQLFIDPSSTDSDNDGLSDTDEINIYHTLASQADSEQDGMPDGWEIQYALDPLTNDADLDLDLDGWTNLQEYNYSSDPTDAGSFPTPTIGFSIDSSNDLYRIDLLAGVTEPIGNTNLYQDFEGLAYGPDGMLYAAEDSSDGLYRIDPTTAVAELIGYMSITGSEMGLTFDTLGDLYLISGDQLYSVDTVDGQTTLVNDFNAASFYSLAWDGTDFYALSQSPTSLYKLDTVNGQAEFIGTPSGVTLSTQNGLSVDSSGQLWGMDERGSVFSIDKANGQVGSIIPTLSGFESFAIENTTDTDNDGMTDIWENTYGLDPNDPSDANVDTDNDGLTNLQEFSLGIDPINSDIDNDGLLDGEEVNTHGTDPSLADSDGDLMPDGWEVQYALDPLTDDADLDLDVDGWTNLQEYNFNADPSDASSIPSEVIGFSIDQNNDLYQINFLTGITELVGNTSISSYVEGLAYGPEGMLYAHSRYNNGLYRIDPTTAQSEFIGYTGVYNSGSGLTFDTVGNLYMLSGNELYLVDTATGQASLVNSFLATTFSSLVWDGSDFYAMSQYSDEFYKLDINTGQTELIATISDSSLSQPSGLSVSNSGQLWGLDQVGNVFSINKTDGRVQTVTVTTSGYYFQSLAIENSTDTDNDGMTDFWENVYGLDANDSSDATIDTDNDDLDNLQEFLLGIVPTNSDTDGDGLLDGQEVNTYGTNPSLTDSDNDNLNDYLESIELGSNPLNSDSDADGISDNYEYQYRLLINEDDSGSDIDQDGLTNYQESVFWTHPYIFNNTDTEPNNSIAQAQNIDDKFSIRYSANVGDSNSNTSESIPYAQIMGSGDESADYFQFTVTQVPARLILDVDFAWVSTQTRFDSYVVLYDESGQTIASDDDSNTSDGQLGSESGLDSYIETEITAAGVYVVKIERLFDRPIPTGNVYQFNISLENAEITDSDQDGMLDTYEELYGLDPFDPLDSLLDPDLDGIVNFDEYTIQTSPISDDTDNDGVLDSEDEYPTDASLGENIAPTIEPVGDLILEATGPLTVINLTEPAVSDNNFLTPTLSADFTEAFELGATNVTWTAIDNVGNQSEYVQVITLVDTTAPEIPNTDVVEVDMNDLLMDVSEFIPSSAIDLVDGEVQVTTNDEMILASGHHIVALQAQDSSGNLSVVETQFYLHPQVVVEQKQYAEPGATVTLEIYALGEVAISPLAYEYSLLTDSSFDMTWGTAVLNSDGKGEIQFTVPSSMQDSERIVVSLTDVTNGTYVDGENVAEVWVTEQNIAPQFDLDIYQQGQLTATVFKDLGVLTIVASIDDINSADEHDVIWSSTATDLDTDSDPLTFEVDPTTLTENIFSLTLQVSENNTLDNFVAEQSLMLRVSEHAPTLASEDTDSDGIIDLQEGYFDNDGDGVANYLDAFDSPSMLAYSSPQDAMMTEGGLKLLTGDVARFSSNNTQSSSAISMADIQGFSEEVLGSDIYIDQHFEAYGQPFNFIVSGLAEQGESVSVVIPLDVNESLPERAYLRKFSPNTGWFDFVSDTNNAIYSGYKSSVGVCPRVNDQTYQAGLIAGATCLKLVIEDGGPNDSDGVANGQVQDPGVLAQFVNTAPQASIEVVSTVNEGVQFTLFAGNSMDDEGDELAFLWQQVSGPTVSIASPTNESVTLMAPQVNADSTVTFMLTVSDGFTETSAEVNVLIRQVVTTASQSSDGGSGGGSMSDKWMLLLMFLWIMRLSYSYSIKLKSYK